MLTAVDSTQSSHTSKYGDYCCDVNLWSLLNRTTRKTALRYRDISHTVQGALEIWRHLVNLRPIKSVIKLLKCSGYNVYHLLQHYATELCQHIVLTF